MCWLDQVVKFPGHVINNETIMLKFKLKLLMSMVNECYYMRKRQLKRQRSLSLWGNGNLKTLGLL